MDVADYLRIGQREDVAVVENVLFAVGKTFAASLFFAQSVGADGCAHGSIQNENAFLQGGGQFSGRVRLRHGETLADGRSFGKHISTHRDMMI